MATATKQATISNIPPDSVVIPPYYVMRIISDFTAPFT
jgi:hypothetical protein